MKLDEMIALAKAGYKKKDIDAIIESENNASREDAKPSLNAETSPVEESAGEESAPIEDEAPTEEDITSEALKNAYAEIESLKKDLAKAQAANVNKEVTNNSEEDSKTIEDMVRSFM